MRKIIFYIIYLKYYTCITSSHGNQQKYQKKKSNGKIHRQKKDNNTKAFCNEKAGEESGCKEVG